MRNASFLNSPSGLDVQPNLGIMIPGQNWTNQIIFEQLSTSREQYVFLHKTPRGCLGPQAATWVKGPNSHREGDCFQCPAPCSIHPLHLGHPPCLHCPPQDPLLLFCLLLRPSLAPYPDLDSPLRIHKAPNFLPPSCYEWGYRRKTILLFD